jgi:hypothetical protein
MKISVNILGPVLELNMPVHVGFWYVVTLVERSVSVFELCDSMPSQSTMVRLTCKCV